MMQAWGMRHLAALLALCAALILVAGYTLGARAAAKQHRAEIAELHLRHENAARMAAEAALARLHAAQARGEELAARVANEQAKRQTEAKEHQREIQRLTTGRACLNAGTVRLLNRAAADANAAPSMPEAAGAIAASNAPAASDTDVAGWADRARREYEHCRSRLAALIDWHTGQSNGRN